MMAKRPMIIPITMPTIEEEDSWEDSARLKISGDSSGDKQVGGVGGFQVPNSVQVKTVAVPGRCLKPGTQ